MTAVVARINDLFTTAGYTLALMARALRFTPKIFFRWRAVVREMWIIGIESLPLCCFFLFLIGMVFAHNVGMGLIQFGQQEYVGGPVAFGMVRELGPWMTA
ncbi:MAG: ABC transporter permease, partial [Planctomycetaceae bacterium]|nr:ABC transporter permease [Planctomycetaceae bacterium]